MVLQHPTLLDSVPFLPVVRIIQTLNSPCQVSTYLPRPLKMRLIFYALEDLVHWLLEGSVASFGALFRALPEGPWFSLISLLKFLRAKIFEGLQ